MAQDRRAPADWAGAFGERWEAFAEELRRRLGAGGGVEPAVRERLQAGLGADPTGAMVHRNPLAGRLAHLLDAEALSIGRHVVGDERKLDVRTSAGTALLAHELVHASAPNTTTVQPPRPYFSLTIHAAREPVPRILAPAALAAPAIQRQASGDQGGDEERLARVIESEFASESGDDEPAPAQSPTDAEALAELVYRKALDELRWERERGAWLG